MPSSDGFAGLLLVKKDVSEGEEKLKMAHSREHPGRAFIGRTAVET